MIITIFIGVLIVGTIILYLSASEMIRNIDKEILEGKELKNV